MSESNLLAFDETLVVDHTATGDVAWPERYVVRDERSVVVGGIDSRRVLGNRLDGTYPIGAEDREVRIHAASSPASVATAVRSLMSDAPRCRRVVLALTVGSLEDMRIAEDGGFRFVVDVDTHDESLSLLVAEPEWVLAQPSAIEDLPL
jgi:hypothetical protein